MPVSKDKLKKAVQYYMLVTLGNVLMRMLGRISSDIYIASVPILIIGLDAPEHIVKLSVSIYFIGLCITNLVSGPISDAIGNRKMLCVSLSLFLLGSLSMLISGHHTALLIGRFVQALGAGTLPALHTMLPRENKLLKKAASQVKSTMSLVVASCPMIGMMLGSYLRQWHDWRAVFYVQIGICLSVIGYYFWMFKYLNTAKPQHNKFNVKTFSRSLLSLIKNRDYLIQGIGCCLVTSALPIYYSLAAFIVTHNFGFKIEKLTALTIVPAIAFAFGKSIWGFIKKDEKLTLLFLIGTTVSVGSGLIMIGMEYVNAMGIFALSGLFSLYAAGAGLSSTVLDTKSTGVMPELSGTANTLLNAKSSICTSILTFLVAHWIQASLISLAIILLSLTAASIICYFGKIKFRRPLIFAATTPIH